MKIEEKSTRKWTQMLNRKRQKTFQLKNIHGKIKEFSFI